MCLIDSLLWEDNVSDLNVLSQAQLVAWSDNLNMFFSRNEQVAAVVATATVLLEPLGALRRGINDSCEGGREASAGNNGDFRTRNPLSFF